MKIKEGDQLRFKVLPGVLLAGKEGICRIEKFEKSQRCCSNRGIVDVVYIEIPNPGGDYIPFARYWPNEIAFAPMEGGEFLPFQ